MSQTRLRAWLILPSYNAPANMLHFFRAMQYLRIITVYNIIKTNMRGKDNDRKSQ